MVSLLFEQLGDLADAEAKLRWFYSSGEPEATEIYNFPPFHRSLIIKDSGTGLGLFLEERAVPGELLLLVVTEISCACTRDYTSYKTDSYVHAPTAVWMPPCPRIPPRPHLHLASKLANLASTNFLLAKTISLLNSHESPQEGKTHGVSSERLLNAIREFQSEECAPHIKEFLDEEKLSNIISNHAVCDKVRTLSFTAPRLVETCELWGLWPVPSLINHSCSPNCNRMRIGKAIIIRAATDIAAGDELTLPYFDIFQPLTARDVNCETFGFRCECRRCTFERSIGQPYDDIQMEILQLKIEVQSVWEVHVKDGSSRLISTVLDRLVSQIPRIDVLIKKLTLKSWDPKNQNKQSSSAKQGVLPKAHPGPSSSDQASQAASADTQDSHSTNCQEKFELDNMQSGTEEHWIKASFIEPYIALYSLCEMGFFRLEERFIPVVTWQGGAGTSRSEKATVMLQVIEVVQIILGIIKEVHPGNMLGQEFYSILLKTCSRFVECDLTENTADNTRYLDSAQSDGMRFFSAYYGFAGAENLKLLLATES